MEKIDFSWRIGGEAGQGIMAASMIFARTCTRSGMYVCTNVEYPSLVRGGHNTVQVRASNKSVWVHVSHTDLLIALNEETLNLHSKEMAKNSGVIYDSKIEINKESFPKEINYFSIPLTKLAKELGGKEVIRNTITIGATIALLDGNLEIVDVLLEDTFKGKKQEIIDMNKKAIRLGYNYVKENYSNSTFSHRVVKQENKELMVLSGNEAVSLGALKAGLKFLAQYPMTPASSILHYLASKEKDYNLVVQQAEDELAAMNMVIGSSLAGVRSMTATSGGGFALMTEAFGLAAMIETPVVVIEVQRSGPSTGMPTWTGQGDLNFVINASQDEFPSVVIAPGDVNECFYATFNAFNFAEKYQLPVIVLSDKQLGENQFSVPMFNTENLKIERGKLLTDSELESKENYERYAFTKDGISPRSIPGQKNGVFVASGYEHNPHGHMDEDPINRVKMVDKRFKKLDELMKEFPKPKLYGKEDADYTIVSWGSTKGALLETIELLEKEGIKANFLHYVYVYPLHKEETQRVLGKAKKKILFENNKTAQLGSLIRKETGITFDYKLLFYNGRQMTATQIVKKIKEVVQ